MIDARPTVSVVICASTEDRWNEMMASVGSAMSQIRHAEEIILVIDHNPVLLRRATFDCDQYLYRDQLYGSLERSKSFLERRDEMESRSKGTSRFRSSDFLDCKSWPRTKG